MQTEIKNIEAQIAQELGVKTEQVVAAVALLDEGATVPFISRYRKEVTGGLTDEDMRTLAERLAYLRELEARRATIIATIEEQGKMTPEFLASIQNAVDKTRLEDLYLPYKPKRRTKAQIAREAGLNVLAEALLKNPKLTPEKEAEKYLRKPFTVEGIENPGVPDAQSALSGAQSILLETFSENADLTARLRNYFGTTGIMSSKVSKGKEEVGEKFTDYFAFSEPLGKIPSHRALALFRGDREGVLAIKLHLPGESGRLAADAPHNYCEQSIARFFSVRDMHRPADSWLLETVRAAWRTKISSSLELEHLTTLKERAEKDAIAIFANNLRTLLLAAPAGKQVTMALDPGIRTGVKVAVVDATGKVLDFATVYPHQPKNDWAGALSSLEKLVDKHNVSLISIGNGTASRETEKLASELIKKSKLPITKAMVSEAGASVYSASAYASKELPDLDVSIRGAVSIGRRLQDPLAELIKIDPKSIGVGQYQHDVHQGDLAKSLDAVVEDCVNAVGVDVNTASVPLLAHVAGLTESIAQNIVTYRDKHGAFRTREELLQVPRLGAKAFEQAAGFLRIMNGSNPLDASAVHPESYALVQKILDSLSCTARDIIGKSETLANIDPKKYADDTFGIPTVTDILKELEKPGRDPRPAFVTATFKEGVETIANLAVGMKLQGVVTNVVAFGAFVDIGVHQDGLVHISQLSSGYVSDPSTVVSAGQIVEVQILEADPKRKRISLKLVHEAK